MATKIKLTDTSTLDEFTQAHNAGTPLATIAAHMAPRIARGSKSGIRAQAWLDARAENAQAAAKVTRKAKAKAPKALKHGRTADGRAVSTLAWDLRARLYAKGIKRTYAECVLSVQERYGK